MKDTLFKVLTLTSILLNGVTVRSAALAQQMQAETTFSINEALILASLAEAEPLQFEVRPSRLRRPFGIGGRNCERVNYSYPILPVLDESDESLPAYLGASSHPVFFLQVPALPGARGILHVDALDSAERNPRLYNVEFNLTNEAGILGIRIPDGAPPLTNNSSYRWMITVQCNLDNNDMTTLGAGVVEKVPDIEGSDDERLDYYLQEGVWQDTLQIIATEHYLNSSVETQLDWQIFMAASGRAMLISGVWREIRKGRILLN